MNVQNERGDTALHLAAYRGFKDLVTVLTRAWADPFVKNAQSKTALQEAQAQQHTSASVVLIKYMEAWGKARVFWCGGGGYGVVRVEVVLLLRGVVSVGERLGGGCVLRL